MSSVLKAVRGTRDLLPPETALWSRVEATARAVFARYGFGEIRTPIFEPTKLFSRSVGEETDIVSKEMYTWEDRARAASEKAQSLTLRPENTAGVVRAYIEHKLGDTGMLQKLFYIGPQFRRERPQRGRRYAPVLARSLRRGHWPAVLAVPNRPSATALEVLGNVSRHPAQMNSGIKGWRLEINSIGSSDDRRSYNAALREALAPVKAQLCEDNQRRAEDQPALRDPADSKAPAPEDQDIINALPRIADFLDESSRMHFAQVLAIALGRLWRPYHVNPRLVRGLDYYTRTTPSSSTVPSSDQDGSGLDTQGTPSSAAAATTASVRCSAAPKPPASASPSAKTASSSLCRHSSKPRQPQINSTPTSPPWAKLKTQPHSSSQKNSAPPASR